MSARRGLLPSGARAVSLLLLGGIAAGCSRESREEEHPRGVELPVRGERLATSPVAPAAPGVDALKDESPPWQGDFDAGQPPARRITLAPSASASAASKPVNPDDAVLERTRVAAGGCFSTLSAGPGAPPERSARLVVTVIPTGTVSHADVSSGDTEDARVLDCIQAAGQSARFSDNGGGPLRTYAIDVHVFAPGGGGGR